MPLRLSQKETDRLISRIETNYQGAIQDHKRRMKRFRELYRLWRKANEEDPRPDEVQKPNYSPPLVRWQTLGAMAQILQSVMGDDGEILAKPVGPSDQRNMHKAARWLCWRLFVSMPRFVERLALALFRCHVFGRCILYMPYEARRTYRGPGYYPLAPDDVIVPVMHRAESIHDFPWVIRRFRATPQTLLDGERAKRYQGIKQNWERILTTAEGMAENDIDGGDVVKREEDDAEGVLFDGSDTGSGTLEVHEWYGKWRPQGKMDEHDIIVRFLPALRLVIGVERLDEVYDDRIEHKRPFEDMALIPDGSYWAPGYGEFLREEAAELKANHNTAQAASDLAACPPVMYDPASGFSPEKFAMEAGMAYPVGDPSRVQVLQIRGDIQGLVVMAQTVRAYAELVTGRSDATLGRSSDRPNQPRTATGQTLLAEASNVRAYLDTEMVRQALRRQLRRIWDLDASFTSEATFFRVTEEEAGGMFETRGGGAMMTPEEFGARYDFDIKFATSLLSREARKQDELALYQADLTNPLIATNPAALWHVSERFHRAWGDSNFADVVPKPPDVGLPKTPQEEWTLMLQGEEVMVNPMDQDDLHLAVHYRQMDEERRSAVPDADAMQKLAAHIVAHQQQKRMKMLMQATAGAAVQGIQQTVAGAMDLAATTQQNQAAGPGAPPQNPMGGM